MRKRPAPPPPPLPRWRRLLPAVALVLSGILVYANAMEGPFIFDDQTSILWNSQIRGVWPLSASLSPPRETPVAGRPLVNLSLALNYAVGGYDVRVYHATNLAIHLLATLALLGVVRRTLAIGPEASPLTSRAEGIAFVCALLWMLHPLQTEVVNYTTQRTTSLKGLMLLLTLYCSVRALTNARRRWRTAAVLACAAGMACKESMVVAPVIVMLFDRAFVFRSVHDAWTARRGLYIRLATTWIILAALLAGGPRTTVGFGGEIGTWTYLLNQTQMIVRYLRLSMWPTGLVYDYGSPHALALADVVWPAAAVVGLALVTLVSFWRFQRIGFLGAWFFITLAPSSSLVPIVTEVGAERRMYLPLAAIVVFLVCGAWHVFGRRMGRTPVVAVCLAACTLLATGTVLRNREYQSHLTLAQTAVDRRPHGRNYFRLGALLIEAGRRQEGIAYLQRAKHDGFPGSRFALATEYMADGNFADAARELAEFVRRRPGHSLHLRARETLGHVYMALDRYEEAAAEFDVVLDKVPLHDAAHEALGDIRLSQQRYADALRHLEHTSTRRPTDVPVMGKLGTALAGAGRVDEATAVFRSMVAADPRNPFARNMLGRSLAQQGRLAEAIQQFELALELAPHDAEAQGNLERARQQMSRR